jgi:ornithine cyclodeaminase/alanine dehydrogenase
MKLRYLSRQMVEEVSLPMKKIVSSVEEVFKLKGEGKVEMPPKPGIHPKEDAFIHAMPAYIPSMISAGIKWVSGYPDNKKNNLPYISGIIILNDPDTGIPICIMDGTWITAKRTGAATAVAAKYLARKDSHTIGILACGVQGESNLEALMEVQNEIETIIAYDIDFEQADKFIEKMKKQFPRLNFTKARNPKEAVVESDIIVTSGPILKNPKQIIEKDWLKDGMFISPVDFDSYWKPEAMFRSHKFCTDDYNQLNHFKNIGYFKNIPNVYADLGEIVSLKKDGRSDPNEIIFSLNLGLALEDMAVAIKVYETALRSDIGLMLEL